MTPLEAFGTCMFQTPIRTVLFVRLTTLSKAASPHGRFKSLPAPIASARYEHELRGVKIKIGKLGKEAVFSQTWQKQSMQVAYKLLLTLCSYAGLQKVNSFRQTKQFIIFSVHYAKLAIVSHSHFPQFVLLVDFHLVWPCFISIYGVKSIIYSISFVLARFGLPVLTCWQAGRKQQQLCWIISDFVSFKLNTCGPQCVDDRCFSPKFSAKINE